VYHAAHCPVTVVFGAEYGSGAHVAIAWAIVFVRPVGGDIEVGRLGWLARLSGGVWKERQVKLKVSGA
tara:strand:+ start:2085 stop:2288 length:204 start_codon:yes stop_codon:yes gene_type:complete